MATVKFFGFDPTLELKTFAKQKLKIILDLAPSDSEGATRLERTGDGFEGELKIYSRAGRFVAKVKSADPRLVIEDLSRKLMNELALWKRVRFFIEPRLYGEPLAEIAAPDA
jgi:hypothetical protein